MILKLKKWPVFLALLFILITLPMHASASKGTGDKAWDAFNKLQEKWLVELRDLIVATQPKLKEIADLSLKWRLAEKDLATMKFIYIKNHDPEKIVRDKGLPAFVNLMWFPEYTEELQKSDPAFKKQENKVAALKKENEKHPDWQALQDHVKSLKDSEKHKPKFDAFFAEMNKVQKVLAQTAADQERQRH